MIANPILWCGKKVLLQTDVGYRESCEASLGFSHDVVERGLWALWSYCSDDSPGLPKAIKTVWPRSLSQECRANKMGNILAERSVDSV